MALATLSIDIIAKLATLEQDLGKAVRIAEKTADDINKHFQSVSDGLKQIGITLATYFSVKAFVNLIDGAIDAQAHLADLAQRAQTTIDQIGGIGFAAKQAGSDLDAAALLMGKLNVVAGKAAADSPVQAELFRRMGISLRDDLSGGAKTATELLIDLANKFSTYEDGPKKAALGNAALGRSYQELLPLLDKGGAFIQQQIDDFKRYSGVSAESALAARDFHDETTKLHLLLGAFWNNLASALVPTMQALVVTFVEAKEKGDGFKGLAEKLADIFKTLAEAVFFSVEAFTIWAGRLDSLMARIAVLQQASEQARSKLFTGDLFGAFDPFKGVQPKFDMISRGMEADLKKAQAEYDAFVKRIRQGPDAGAFEAGFTLTPPKRRTPPDVPVLGGTDAEKAEKALETLLQKWRELDAAEHALDGTQKELAKAMAQLADPKYDLASPAKKQQILDFARDIEHTKAVRQEYNQAIKDALVLDELQAADWERLQKEADKMAHALDALKASTPTEQLKVLRDEMTELADRFLKGTLSAEQFNEMAQTRLGTLPQNFAHVTSQMEDIALDSAHKIDGALGEGLADLLEGKFSSIGDAFKRMLESIVVQATKADIMGLLFGSDFAKGSGGFGGLLTTLFPSLAGIGGISPAGGAGVLPPITSIAVPQSVVNVPISIASGVSRSEIVALVPAITQQVQASVMQTMRRPGFSGG